METFIFGASRGPWFSGLGKYFAFFSMIYWSIVGIIIYLGRHLKGLSIYVKCVETVRNSGETPFARVHRQWRMPDCIATDHPDHPAVQDGHMIRNCDRQLPHNQQPNN
jgi:hypothetical protein